MKANFSSELLGLRALSNLVENLSNLCLVYITCWYVQRKGVSPDTPSHIIQKHYEFYLANKIKSYRYVDYIQYGLFCLHSYCATLQVRSLRSQ